MPFICSSLESMEQVIVVVSDHRPFVNLCHSDSLVVAIKWGDAWRRFACTLVILLRTNEHGTVRGTSRLSRLADIPHHNQLCISSLRWVIDRWGYFSGDTGYSI